MKALFIDDEKKPEWFNLPADMPRATSYYRALGMLRQAERDGQPYEVLYLDYDLGITEMKGDKILDYFRPKKVCIISWNVDGVEAIKAQCERYGIEYELHSHRHNLAIIDGQSG